ncbi:DUF4252 domain-containing protein [Lutibacter holmesii]|uniref:DUF4252 domain-containing protein n=1 Tax=Lutibacter holmesii TaxID=1137985 RepID=A0ABW3WMW6_9FLAO
MKKRSIILVLFVLVITSCSPTYQQFYNSHKNDVNSTAFQMPRFLVNILGGLSPETNSFFKNMNDFSYITLKNVSPEEWELINIEINSITNKKYTDILRKTEIDQKTIISAKEIDGIVKELIYFKYQNNNVNSFYIKGNFDSNKIEQLVSNNEFENLSSKLLEYQN